MMIHFPRKRYLFVSTTRTIQMRNQETKKIGSLKYFEVCSVQEKVPKINGWKFIKSINQGSHLIEVGNKS
jgi:hypothetical protein